MSINENQGNIAETNKDTASERRTVGGEQASVSGVGTEGLLVLPDVHTIPEQQSEASERLEGNSGVCPCNTPPSTIHTYTEDTDIVYNNLILKTGIDSLYIGYVVESPYQAFYEQIKQLKSNAQNINGPIDFHIRFKDDPSLFMNFEVEPKGRRNYPYVFWNDLCTIQVFGEGNTGFNPRVYIELRSSFIEEVGEHAARKIIEKLIESVIGEIDQNRSGISRIDIFADILLDKSQFTDEIESKLRCRAHKTRTVKDLGKLETLYIGEKNAPNQCRMYDKGKEREKAKCFRKYLDSVNLKEIPVGKIIVRIEFQLRRAFLHEHKIKGLNQLPGSTVVAWEYLTTDWLRVVKKKGKTNSGREENEEWWNVIREAFGHNAFKLYRKSSSKKLTINLENLTDQIFFDLADLLAKCMIIKKPSCINLQDDQITLQKGIDVFIELLMLLVLFKKIPNIDEYYRNNVYLRLDDLLEKRKVISIRRAPIDKDLEAKKTSTEHNQRKKAR